VTTVHLFQWVAAFLAATAITGSWLLTRPRSRWRHIVAGIVSTLLWIPVAYTAGNVGVADGGEIVTFGSQALAGVATFMAVASLAGILLGLLLWVEEEVDAASDELPANMRSGPSRRGGD
jgi:hypothetical protein